MSMRALCLPANDKLDGCQLGKGRMALCVSPSVRRGLSLTRVCDVVATPIRLLFCGVCHYRRLLISH